MLVWRNFGSTGLNKVGILYLAAAVLTMALFVVAGTRRALVPRGFQTVAEAGVEFVQKNVILETMGPDGIRFTTYLTTLFFFILFSNLFEIIPGIQFPPMARMAMPLVLALITYGLYNVEGIRAQGFGHYIKNSLVPPGVPVGLLPLVVLIEFVSHFIVKPFSLAVRLFANMLAGHLLLVTFAVLAQALFKATYVGAVVPAVVLVALTAFELLVAFLQAFIFAILTAVYLGGAMHPEH